jgi:2-keto-3-deoxy-L-arabinonate dehydratase
MNHRTSPRYRGLFPVVPTPFTERGELDLSSQKRCIDFMIDAGSNGLCILANFSEQFMLSDDERETLTRTILEHVAGRVPVIVTTTHFSTKVCSERSRRAQEMGAAMIMVMPPYHGATFRVPEDKSYEFFANLSDAIGIPIMIQDAPASGTNLSATFLARMAREIEQVSYFKIETPAAASKLRELKRLGGDAVEGPWDGEEAITLLADLDAGATGSMTGGGFPDGLRPILDHYAAGLRDKAIERYERWLPLINIENRLDLMRGRHHCGEAPRDPYPRQGALFRSELASTAIPIWSAGANRHDKEWRQVREHARSPGQPTASGSPSAAALLAGHAERREGDGDAGGAAGARPQRRRVRRLADRIGEGDQFGSGFVEVNPNSKIPALMDRSGPSRSGCSNPARSCLHLAEKFGAFLPTDPAARAECLSWLFWQMGSAPYLGGGFGHFYAYAPTKIEYAIDRFAMEVKRQLDVLDRRLARQRVSGGRRLHDRRHRRLALVRRLYNAGELYAAGRGILR